ncbi:uncharacterized protein LOC124161476 [Ischnura elegans]|uniref:uncharacterized protein LOC124161476 n=1 Tax=Ischnura elegans TaxID=197161 RepID=UPI001ED89A80|nr:uncharacterized protein LOC124161476 [Ischnura elegans]
MAEEEITEKIDLSGKGLKKLDKAVGSQTQATVLILDDNELQRLDNVGTYSSLQKLSAVRNQLIRMYGVSKLLNLTSLNLAHNNLVGIEGLKELLNLRWLCLAGNNVKAIDHLNTNINLEHLDLSENNIGSISDLSHLQNLKELLLHGNRISGLQFCQRYLPLSLESLSLADNRIADLNEVCHVSHLPVLREFTIAGNPCVAAAAAVASHPHTPGQCVGFDYRPFVINWCMNLRVLDGYLVDAKESLRAEWLYSQGKGRSFRVGEQEALIVYLSSVCPPLPSGGGPSVLSGPRSGNRPLSAPGGSQGGVEAAATPPAVSVASDNSFPSSQPSATLSDEDRKLLLILSKAQLHQRELREQQKADKGGSVASSSAHPGFGMSSSYSSALSSTTECAEESALDAAAASESTNGRNSERSRPSSSFASPYVRRRVKEPPSRGSPKRCGSRTSSRQDQHHLRRYSSTGGEMVLSSSSYNVELPVTLYGDESNAMVASMDEERVSWAGLRRKESHKEKENLMTRSLDPSLLSCATEDTGLECADPQERGEDLTSNHRPKKLFSQGRVGEDGAGMSVETTTELKEEALQEALTDEGNENPLQTATKLVPVPESIVSPEYRPQASYMPSASVPPRQTGQREEVERRRGGQGPWGSSSSRCCPTTSYYHPSAPSANANHVSSVGPANAAQSSVSSPGTRRANVGHHHSSGAYVHHHHYHHAPTPPLTERCASRHSNSSGAMVHGSSAVVPSAASAPAAAAGARGPPPIPSYYPTSIPNSSGSPLSTRHACHVSSFHHNPVQQQSVGTGQGSLSRSGSGRRGSARSDAPHSPAMSRVSRAPSRGAKIRKAPTPAEAVGGGGKGGRATRGGGARAKVAGAADEDDSSGDNSDSEMSISKLEAIKCVAVGRRQKEEEGGGAEEKEGGGGGGTADEEEERKKAKAQERAVLKIQSLWRGYRCRSLEPKTSKKGGGEDTFDAKELKEDIRAMRMEDHIRVLSKELEVTRGELGKERKLRLQQMEAIKSLWKEVYSMQNKGAPNCIQSPVEGVKASSSEVVASQSTPAAVVDANVVAELSRTCASLQGQVQHLQDFLKQVMQYMSSGVAGGQGASRGEVAIQTYISAVMTPQGLPPGGAFPFVVPPKGGGDGDARPSYLPIFGGEAATMPAAESSPPPPKDDEDEEDVSREMQHYVDGLVDGVLKAVVPEEEGPEGSV